MIFYCYTFVFLNQFPRFCSGSVGCASAITCALALRPACTAVHSYNRSGRQKVTLISKKTFFEEHYTIIVHVLGKSSGFVLIHFQKSKQTHCNRPFQRWYNFVQITVKLVACNPAYALTGKPFFHNIVLVINSPSSLKKYSRVTT